MYIQLLVFCTESKRLRDSFGTDKSHASGIPTKGEDTKHPGKTNDESKKESSLTVPPNPPGEPAAAAAAVASSGRKPGGAYPDPSNFAERLMHVLDNEIAKESLWWLGKGEAIAVHPEKIKASPVLASHFQGNRYTSFVRNLNRW